MKRLLPLLCISALVAIQAAAQTKGTIWGYARDPTGANVSAVKVTITNQGTGAQRTAATNASGLYQFLGLVSGLYTIEAESPGFKRHRNTNVALQVDDNLRADIELQLGSVSESIEVVANAVQIDTRSSEASVIIDDRRIVDLPLSNRNVFALAKTIPGVLNVTAPDNTRFTSSRSGSMMNVNGGRGNMNYNRFNGAYFMNPSRNTGLNVPPPDAIQELKIQTSNFAADTGRNPGANITIVSKQGTNEFRGSAWEFHRNDNLNARSFFQGVKPQLIKNQYGAAAGGRVRRDKIFVFGTFEVNDDREQPTVVDSSPPSTPEINGNFSHLNGVKQLVNPADRTPFPNNQIPRSLFDPVALKLLEFAPAVATPGTRFQSISSRPRDSELYMIRSDFNFTGKQTLFGTYYLNQNKDSLDGAGAFGTDFNGWTGQENFVRVHTAGVNHVYVLSPALLNQLTLGYTRSFSILGPTVTRTPDSLGIRNFPAYTNAGSPRFVISGRWDLQSGSRDKFVHNTYQIKNDMSLTRGRHTLRFGFEHMDIGWFQAFLGPPIFNFTGLRTGGGNAPRGDSQADFMLGAYDNVGVSAGVRHNDDATTYSVFHVQDDFKISPRLTLNLGLRYELPTPWVEKFDRLNKVVLDANAKSAKIPQAPPALLFPGDTAPAGNKVPRGMTKTDKNNFAPRVGFAWDVFGDGRTAVRSAYGIFYETANGDTLAQTNPPFVVGSRTLRDGRLIDPYGSVNEIPLPIAADPASIQFILPLRGLWGPQVSDFATTKIHNWSFLADRAVGRDYTIGLGYIGKKGQNLLAFRPFNAAIFRPGTDARGNALSTRANIPQRVPFLPGIYDAGGLYLDNVFRSNYHSFQVELKKRFSGGVQFSASYTLSKSLDNSSTTTLGGGLTDPYRPGHDYGRSDWDRRHAAIFSGVWALPFLPSSASLAGKILGGWTLSNITTIYSGAPVSVTAGEDTALNGAGGARADIVGDPGRGHSSRHDMITRFFNTSAFRRPPDGGVGTSARGMFSGPAQVNTDLALLKDFTINEQIRFQLRAEAFNAFNQVNFSNPRNSLTDARIGQIIGAADGRSMLLGLKFLW
jgi:hypothetical protein